MTLAEAVERFKVAKAELRACGLPLDVIDAALRPLFHGVRIMLEDRAARDRSERSASSVKEPKTEKSLGSSRASPST